MSMIEQQWAGLAFSLIWMAGAWWASKRVNNMSFIDPAWSAGFSPLVIFYAVASPGAWPRKIAVAAIVLFWSARLTAHLMVRLLKHHPAEDERYVDLRRRWGGSIDLKFFGLFLFEGLLFWFLSLPFLLVSFNGRPFSVIEILGFVLFAAAIAGETLADAQLKRFKADPANKGGICQTGLWNYSRHPNYFFEWLVWCAFFLIALGSHFGWVAIYAPLIMLLFLTKLSGIPLAEAQALKSRGDAYRRYQETTSPFIPWLKRNPS